MQTTILTYEPKINDIIPLYIIRCFNKAPQRPITNFIQVKDISLKFLGEKFH